VIYVTINLGFGIYLSKTNALIGHPNSLKKSFLPLTSNHISVEKWVFSFRLTFLTLFFLMSVTTGKAQPDTIQIDRLLKSGSNYLFNAHEEQNNLDSALFYFNQALTLSQTLHLNKWINTCLEWKGICFFQGEMADSARTSFQKVIDYYHSKGDLASEANTWKNLGDAITQFDARFAPEKAASLENAYRLYWEIRDTVNAMESLKAAADAHLYEPRLDISEKELLTVLAVYKSMHYPYIYYTYDLLRVVSELKGDLVTEVSYVMEMIRSLDSADLKNREDSMQAGRLYSYAGMSYAYAAMWDQALFFARKGWNTLQFTDYDEEYFSRLSGLAIDLVRNDSAQTALQLIQESLKHRQLTSAFQKARITNALGICYQALGEIKNAETEFSKILYILAKDKLPNEPRHLQGRQEMMIVNGNFYLTTHQYDKASFYANRLPSEYTYLTTLGQKARIELLKARVDSVAGRYQSALKHFALYQQLNDSLFGIQKTAQIRALQIRYTLDKKDNDMLLQAANIQLLKKENEFQQLQVGKSRNLRNMMSIALLFLLLFVAMGYNRYRIKQRQNRQLESKQSEISAKNRQLEQLLQENRWLLQEVHHRVKNNLQTVISLLTSQMESAEKGPAVDAIRESRQRIDAMAMIHQRLYNSNDHSSISMPAYVTDLVEHLREAFKPGPRIIFSLLIDDIVLDISAALPAALILNEAISNSLKHAFPGEMQGTITVRFIEVPENRVKLEVQDDGIGFHEKTFNGNKSFGIRLIKGLISDVSGEGQIINENGTTVRVFFSIDSFTGKVI
jgi:two-component system, sensor histidine kinase PdtaS